MGIMIRSLSNASPGCADHVVATQAMKNSVLCTVGGEGEGEGGEARYILDLFADEMNEAATTCSGMLPKYFCWLTLYFSSNTVVAAGTSRS